MKVTNFSGLPEALVNAIRNDPYTRGEGADYTITQILKPPRALELERRHADEITEDAAQMMYRLYGQITHQILERANELDLAEKRFFAKFNGLTLSGQIDSLSLRGGVLSEYKFCNVWKLKNNQPPDPDFVAQLNMQLELLRQNGLDASRLQVVGMARDFRLSESKANPGSYPKTPIVIVPIPMWPRSQTVAYIQHRMEIHERAKHFLPDCTQHERWAKPDIHAVMRGARAINGGLKETQAEALEMHRRNPGTRIEFRPAVSKRCASYCNVQPFCTQYQKLAKEKK